MTDNGLAALLCQMCGEPASECSRPIVDWAEASAPLEATIATLRAALDEVDDRLDTLFSTAPNPQDDPESWAQAVYFARDTCERALAMAGEAP